MIRIVFFSLIVVLLASHLTRTGLAQDQRQAFGYRIGRITSSIDHCCWSANDYCRKLFPCDPCDTPGCFPNCYDRKPQPLGPCLSSCATADDYLRKCYPRPPGQCATPGLPRKIFSKINCVSP